MEIRLLIKPDGVVTVQNISLPPNHSETPLFIRFSTGILSVVLIADLVFPNILPSLESRTRDTVRNIMTSRKNTRTMKSTT